MSFMIYDDIVFSVPGSIDGKAAERLLALRQHAISMCVVSSKLSLLELQASIANFGIRLILKDAA